MAKQMIRMICKLGKLIDEDPAVRGKLRIVYLEDYCVSPVSYTHLDVYKRQYPAREAAHRRRKA